MNTISYRTNDTRQHFAVLDGLRGVAALSVVIFHFMEIIFTDWTQNFIGHGFLGVDFFFCLSGFVIGYAYDNRMEKLGITEFFKARVIRLHPLVVVGSVLGLLTFLFDPFSTAASGYGLGRIIILFISSLLLIPFPVMEDRAFNLFGLNAPSWSLFWEYIANILYAFILCRLSRKYLTGLFIIATIVLFYVSYTTGSLMGGWSGATFWEGGARIFYSFLAGLLVYRSSWIIKNKLGFIVPAILLFLAFIMPFISISWITETLVVFLYFPFLVALGAGTDVSEGIKKCCNLIGKISYPLYMTHYGALWIFGNYYNTYKPKGNDLVLIVAISVILLALIAYLMMIWVDQPLRKYLQKRWLCTETKNI
ncbi:acyltransferase [Pedobacter frigidisoli]|uniref:acyltransferase family protein n=1 Tax=Pedobacter frigidisoli TaxID=2530455 RepID=UPI002930CCC3|nr:acyltransferase [Pedobacter frigidisoli]